MALNLMLLWLELMILQAIVGYCFSIANAFIGLYNIKDLNVMKGNATIVKAHKRFGWIEISIFYAITIQCLYTFYFRVIVNDPNLYRPSGVWAHSWFGGFIAVCLVSFKFIIARWKKNEIYKYGLYLGPIGFTGWSIAYWTSIYNFYYVVNADNSFPFHFIPSSIIGSVLIPFLFGAVLFLIVLYKIGFEGKGSKLRFGLNQIAFVLHGITFGYEKSAKELIGTPALFKYVVPKTYEFIERMMTMSGFDMNKLEKMSVPDAMEEFMKMATNIGMAEKVKVKWESESSFTVESINCSTSSVRSVMTAEELTNAICPWAIFAASIANKITGKELQLNPSEFNEIGAKTKLTILDK
ncbi:MAG: hypothetical protein ACFFAO_11445 [Candidatus Hermodarchaeota archaeon]